MPRIKRCCVPNCPNAKYYAHSQMAKLNPPTRSPCTFRIFKFPLEKSPQRARKWAEAIGKPEMVINSTTFICSDHFRKVEDFGLGNRRRLGAWAIPSLFLSNPAPATATVAVQKEEVKTDVDQGKGATTVLEKGQSCLICSSDTPEIGEFRSPLRFTSDGDQSSKLLDDQLWSTFILREVLKLPKADYQNLLGKVGGSVHPSKWFVVCQICERTSIQILNVYQSLRKLERKLERLSGTLKSGLQESLMKEEREQWELKEDKQEDNTILNVRQEIRKRLRTIMPSLPKQEPLEEENMISDDFDETWLPSPPPLHPEPVKQENSLPSPTTCLESPRKDRKVSAIPSVKKRQLTKRNNLLKPKRVKHQAQPQVPTPRPRRIRIRKKRKPTPAMCDLCGHNFSSQCDLEKHMVTHKMYDNCINPAISTTHFICNLCPSSALFPSRKLLSAHKREQHAEELNLHIFKCSECPETFFWKNFFNEHLLRKHPLKFAEQDDHDKQKVLVCDKCDYQTIVGCHLRRHAMTHQSEPLICQYCSSPSKNAIALHRHMKIHHPEELQIQGKGNGKRPNVLYGGLLAPRRSGVGTRFPCKNCDAVFPNKLDLKLHLESTHKDLFTYQCDMCDKSYLSAPSLQTHKKIKHVESGKKAKCGWCGKIVNHKIYLWTHMKYCPKKPEATEGTGPAINAVELT